MASRKEDNEPRPSSAEQARALVYVPCPACGRAVQLSEANRLYGETDTYVCPNCTNRFVFTDTES